jgi:hypothetical protein
MILTLALAVLVGISLGMLGGGGTILTVPILMYAAGLPAKAAIATSLLVVAASSAVGAFQQRRRIDLRTALIFGAAGMTGAYGGGRLAELIPEKIILLLFALMMVLTAVMMLRASRTSEARASIPEKRPIARILGEGIAVGAVTGLVGAGGGFLVVPALVLLGGLAMKEAVATSLLVIAMKSSAGLAGYLGHVTIDASLAISVAGAAVAGSLAGGLLVKRVSAARLKKTFAALAIVTAAALVVKELPDSIYRVIFVERWPWWAGGAAIAAVAVGLLYFKNQLLGVSTGYAELARPCALRRGPSWRIAFLGGIVLGGVVSGVLAGSGPTWSMGQLDLLFTSTPWAKPVFLLAGGVLVGFGARRAGGCTSGHAIVGVAQGARSSVIATAVFLIAGALTANVISWIFGGHHP